MGEVNWSEDEEDQAQEADSLEDFTHTARYLKSVENLGMIANTEFLSNPFSKLKIKIFLAASARSGSNLMCERLQEHGARIGELFNPRKIREVCDEYELTTIEQYCEHAIKTHSRNGVFGVKGSLSILIPLYLSGEFPDHISDWRFVYLKREDTVKQAISHYIAQLSGSFRSVKAGRSVREDEFDEEEIENLVSGHQRVDAGWERTFSALGIEPFRVTYEALAADPSGVAATVAKFLGLPGEPIPNKKPPAAALQKQASTLNAIWEARFRQEKPDLCAEIPQS